MAASRRVAIHQGGEFVVGQPDLRHARPPMEPKIMFQVQF